MEDFDGFFEAFDDFKRPIDVVRPGVPTGGFDDQDRQLFGPESRVNVQGVLQPIGIQERSLMQVNGGIGAVPSFVAWLPITAPVAGMDYHLEVGGLSYFPWADAQDTGGVEAFYRVQLGSPGQRRA